MGFWKKIKQALRNESTDASWEGQHYNFTSWDGINFGGFKTANLENNEEIFSIITRLANTVASLPLHEFKKYDQTSTSLSDLLTVEPNTSMSSYELRNQLEVSRNVSGNGYLFIERDNYLAPIALWPLDPNLVVVKRDIDTGEIWYQVSMNDKNFLLFNTDVIHVKHISPLTDFVGISPLDVLKGTLKFSQAVQDFSLEEMKKKDAFIIKYDRSIDEEKRKALIADFRRMVKENGGAIVQEKGFDIERYESKFQPSDLQTVNSITKQKIANAFNVPLTFLDSGNQGNAKSSESIMTQFVQMTLIPIVKQYESEFNRKLLTPAQRARGYYFKFNLNGLMRGDTQSRTAFYQMMIRNGLATPNELRKLEDLPEVKEKNANELWFSKDLALLAQADKFNAPTNSSSMRGGENPSDNKNDQSEDAKLSDNQTRSADKQNSKPIY